jgi:hypothetical protein
VLPIDNQWLAGSAREIAATAKAVFDDYSQNAHLRALCLQFLALDQADILADVKRVYRHTRGGELRFAIEKSFLEVSDALYQSVRPPGGPIASVVMAAPPGGCLAAPAGAVVFVASSSERKDYQERRETAVRRHYVMTNLQTRQRFPLDFADLTPRYGWGVGWDGQNWFELAKPTDFPAGEYTLGLEYERGGEILSAGYTVKVRIRNEAVGKMVSVN